MLSVSCSRCAFPFRVTRKRRVILLPIRIYIYIYSSPRGSSISRIIPLFSPHSFRSSYFFSPVVVSSPLPVSTLYFPTCTRHRYFNDREGTFIPPLSGYRRMRNFKDETRARLVHYFLSKCFRYFVRVVDPIFEIKFFPISPLFESTRSMVVLRKVVKIPSPIPIFRSSYASLISNLDILG